MHACQQCFSKIITEEGAAGIYFADALFEFLLATILEQVPFRPCLDHGLHMRVVCVDADGDYLDIRVLLADEFRGTYAIHDRHFDIHEDDIHFGFGQQVKRFLSVTRLLSALDIRHILKQQLDALGDYGMVIGEKEVDHG